MSADLLSPIPRHGALRISLDGGDPKHFSGWFHLEGKYVMRRAKNDLVSRHFCELSEVIEFLPGT